jgi:glutathione S-transferase
MGSSYLLFGRPGSGSYAVQIALEEIGAPYERIWVGKEPEAVEKFRALNPAGRVPALRLPDGYVLSESAAILIHLSLAHPAAKMAPELGTAAHARYLQWMVYLSANIYETALRYFYSSRYSSRGEADSEVIRAQATSDYLRQLELISRQLSPYVLGGQFTLVDAYLHMLASWCPLAPELLYQQFPSLGEHARLVAARPTVVKADADNAG